MVLIYVPHGDPADATLDELLPALFEHWNHGPVIRDQQSPTAKAVALLRNQFGGHPLHRIGELSVPTATGASTGRDPRS